MKHKLGKRVRGASYHRLFKFPSTLCLPFSPPPPLFSIIPWGSGTRGICPLISYASAPVLVLHLFLFVICSYFDSFQVAASSLISLDRDSSGSHYYNASFFSPSHRPVPPSSFPTFSQSSIFHPWFVDLSWLLLIYLPTLRESGVT